VTGKERIADFPNVPTTAEAGLPSFELATWTGLLAPAGTPPDIISKLNKEIISILDEPAVRQKWTAFGIVSASSSPKGFDKIIGDNIDAFTKAAIAANIQAK
jgi:tripartite-type tricarboxylate transporter receptor subunit TctC